MSEEAIELLRRVGIRAPRDALSALLSHATKSRWSPVEVIQHLVALESREREARNLARRTKIATLGSFKSLDAFDWNHPRQIPRDAYEQLQTLEFMETGSNILLRGPSGVGKTTLAQNIGLRALERGHTVRFITLATALTDLLRQDSLPAFERRLRHYTNPDLLVVDEIGYLPCDNRSADIFYNIITRRHEKKSTVVTTNLPFKQWNTIFPGAACVVALVDRFAQHCHTIDIEADSWRQKSKADGRSRKV